MTEIEQVRRVVCAANRNNATGIIACGARHFDSVMHRAIEQMPSVQRDDWRKSEQGFIDQHGVFLTREEAWKVAEAAGQIIRCTDWQIGSLHSEHLY